MLRRLLVDRAGRLELPGIYPMVALQVSRIVAGTLDDPDYARRPVGANVLPVVLLDEAAYAAGHGMDGFAGTWTLTKLPDGVYAASAIADTPFRADAIAGRAEVIANARANLHAAGADVRLHALEMLDTHPDYSLVPDAIALLDDPRAAVRASAYTALHRMMLPLADDAMPDDTMRPAWDAYWQGVLTRAPALAPIAPGSTTVLARVAMNQSWPELAALDGGVVAVGVSRLDHPLDSYTDGVAMFAPPWDTHAWANNDVREGFDGAGSALLSVDTDDHWHLQLGTADVAVPLVATHAAIAASGTGYAIVGVRENTDALFGILLDASGRLVGGEHRIPLSQVEPAASYHHGIHPIAIVRRSGGYLVAFETQTEIFIANLDDNLAPAGPVVQLADNTDIAQAKLAISGDRALVAWTRRHNATRLATAIVDLGGKPGTKPALTGSEVDLVARPLALDDGGFAVAWIESDHEVHLGRWTHSGERASDVVVGRGADPFALALTRDGDRQLAVVYEDATRYPFAIVARRVTSAR